MEIYYLEKFGKQIEKNIFLLQLIGPIKILCKRYLKKEK